MRGPLFVALAVLVTGATAFVAFSPELAGTLTFWALAGGPSVALALVAAVWASREALLRDWITPGWGDFTRGAVATAVLVAVAWGASRVVTPVGSSREIWLVTLYGQLGDPHTLQAHGGEVAATIAIVVLAEEILWRGLVTQLVADRVGTRTAWIWAAGLYALAYVPTAWSLRAGTGAGSLDPLLPLAALGAGLVLGAMGRAFGRLTPGILTHALFDWAIVMMVPLWGPHSR